MACTWLKRLSFLCSILAMAVSAMVGSSPGYAARAAHPLLPVRLCTSLPTGAPFERPVTTGINNSVILATEQWMAHFRAAHLLLLPPLLQDDGLNDGTFFNPNREGRNAVACAHRHDTFGYIGPYNSAAAPYSEPVLNRAGMVQLGPSTTYPYLTSPSAAIREGYEPATYAHRLAYVTFYRTITTDAFQGPSAAAVLKSALGARTYFLVDDRSTYGVGLSGSVAAYAARIGLRLIGTQHLDRSAPSSVASSIADSIIAKQPDGVYFAGTYFYGRRFLKDLRQKGYTGPLVGSDGICDPAYTTAVNTYCTETGLDPSAAAQWFQIAYERRFHVSQAYFAGPGHPDKPLSFAAPAYDAATIVLHAIYQAATHGTLRGSLFQMRTAILPYVAHVRWRGATGLTSFDRNGDTTNRIVSVYTARKRQWVYSGVAPKVRGVNPTGG